MDLITKNKIAGYIEQYPEAETSFLFWLKDLDYKYGERLLSSFEKPNGNTAFVIECQLGIGDYITTLCVNPLLKTAYIIWLGSKADYFVYEEEKLKAKYPNSKFERKQITTTVVLPAPDIHMFSKKKPQHTNTTISATWLTKNSVLNVSTGIAIKSNDPGFKTKAEYDTAIEKVISLFYSKPQTPEFDELALLLPLLKNYEANHFKLPEITPLDAIKYKMKMLEITTSQLTHIIGSSEDADLFFSGGKAVSKNTLGDLYRMLCINFPVGDER